MAIYYYDENFMPGILKIRCTTTNRALLVKCDMTHPQYRRIIPDLMESKYAIINPELQKDFIEQKYENFRFLFENFHDGFDLDKFDEELENQKQQWRESWGVTFYPGDLGNLIDMSKFNPNISPLSPTEVSRELQELFPEIQVPPVE